MDDHQSVQKFSAKSEKGKTDFRLKKRIFSKYFCQPVKCSFHTPAETFHEKAEKSHPKFRKKESILDDVNYKVSSKRSSGDVERSFDDHVEAFHGKANIFPFRFQKWFEGKFSQRKYSSSKNRWDP